MTVDKKQENGDLLLELNGRLDTITSTAFQKELLDTIAQSDSVMLDFGNIEYVSSAGLRALLTGHKASMAKGCTMTLRNVRPEVMEVFEMTGFDELLNIQN